uniref:Uncharacterized protein n=1 Tax=Candidatus Kentrum sp. LPFa TaxID=2126335 RepID=A0A450VUN7_9GAMM|nr:MAG: hypothetical protein BECKLPF1236A_GA0070988_100174 [Candidatus Kentron sp. LPFa]VFK24623.1 MAG: hypothetical protein BECKLPF1236C_GA0070990_100155 [Candidatus Kentron sp. LPFa]
MFDNDIFEKWLDEKSQEIVEKMGQGEPLRAEEMMVLVLKAQSNHFHHLDQDLRNEMKGLREDSQDEMKALRGDFQNGMQTLRTDLRDEMKALRGDFQNEMQTLRGDFQNGMQTLRTDSRDEMQTLRGDMDKRFEQVMRRIDRFMFWSLGITVAAATFVVTYLK